MRDDSAAKDVTIFNMKIHEAGNILMELITAKERAVSAADEDEVTLSSPVVFVAKNHVLTTALTLLFSLGFLAITFLSIAHGVGVLFGSLMGFLAFSNLLVASMSVLGASDIVISRRGISRRLLGKTWRTIDWDNVKIVKSFHVIEFGFRAKSIRAFSIEPIMRPKENPYFPGRISFTENFVNFDHLTELLSGYVAGNGIQIEYQPRAEKK